jgi:hypothetical protein
VAAALELQNQMEANWEYGVEHAYQPRHYQIFVTPPVKGWTLAMGMPLAFQTDDQATARLVKLSRQFEEVQYFASERVSDAYIWARAAHGKLVRFFSYEDGEIRTIGPISQEEKGFGFKFFDPSSPEVKGSGDRKRNEHRFPDEECVLMVAALWSINPEELDKIDLKPSLGLLGGPSASYPPKPDMYH